MQKLKLDVSKIPKEAIFIGKKGKYIDLVLHENKNGTDEFGNDGFIAVDTTKEQRERGERGPIVGNWKHLGQKPSTPAQPKPQPPPGQPPYDDDDGSGIPF